MPIAKFEMPDGRIARFEVPDGVTPEQAQSMIEGHIADQSAIDTGNPLMNAVKGFAARGNEAMAALNPWADQERIAAEQEWVKQHPGAGIGETVADMMITAPAGGAPGLAGRALASAGMEGLTNIGSIPERIQTMGEAALGSGFGEKLAGAIGTVVRPFKPAAGAVAKSLVEKAKAIGIPLNAAQVTGNKALQAADSALDNLWASSTAQQEFKDAQRKAWTAAVLKQGGEDATNVSPEVMGGMKDRISGMYEDLSSRNTLKVDDKFRQELADVSSKLMQRIPTNQKRIVASYLKDFGTIPKGADVKAEISGKEYQDIRSMLDKQAKAFKNSDPATSEALRSIRAAADNAMARGLSKVDLAAWNKANKDWAVMRTVEKAADPVSGELSPAKLANALKQMDTNRMVYGKGDQELADIARVGKQFLSPKVGDSGTAQRAYMMKLLSGEGLGAMGLGSGALALYNPAAAATAATSALLGGVMLPKAAGAMIRSPNGYLARGLADLSKEAAPGITREAILRELMRNTGIQAAQ